MQINNIIDTLEIAIGDLIYLANERDELKRFKGTIDKLCAAIKALPALAPAKEMSEERAVEIMWDAIANTAECEEDTGLRNADQCAEQAFRALRQHATITEKE